MPALKKHVIAEYQSEAVFASASGRREVERD
jgi:hypothetical protein